MYVTLRDTYAVALYSGEISDPANVHRAILA